MGNAISFRLNPKCESDRKILDWLEKKSSQPGYLNQTELIKQALLSTMESEQRGIREKKTTEWMDEAILRVTKEFTKVVQESSQNVANNMFAGVLGAMAQQMNMGVVPVTPMQTTGAVPNGMTVAVPNATQNAMPMAVTVNVPEVRADKERSSCRSVKFLQLLCFYATIMLLENVTGGESCGG